MRVDRPEVYPALQRSFSGSSWVYVVVDRRRGERRHSTTQPALDRRVAGRGERGDKDGQLSVCKRGTAVYRHVRREGHGQSSRSEPGWRPQWVASLCTIGSQHGETVVGPSRGLVCSPSISPPRDCQRAHSSSSRRWGRLRRALHRDRGRSNRLTEGDVRSSWLAAGCSLR